MKAAEEMTREEFIEKWGASMGHGFTDEELSADLDSLSLPPAEGATDKFRDVLNEAQRYIETNGGATESEMKAIWNSLSCAITESEKRRPTAEGTEEHRQRHIKLHKDIDELFADFIRHNPDLSGYLEIPVGRLLAWSYEQTKNPKE